jgi:Heavy metal associated domain 2
MSHAHPKHRKREKNADNPPKKNEPVRLVHHHPGYLRARAKAFESTEDDAVVATARAAAEAIAGFRSWSHNPKTGSIVVRYEPDAVDPDDLLKHIATAAGLSGVESDSSTRSTNAATEMNREELVSVFMDKVQNINGLIGNSTGGRADLRELVPVAFLVTSVVSFVLNGQRGRLPSWNSALYHGYRVFMHWHRQEKKERESSTDKSARNEGPESSDAR